MKKLLLLAAGLFLSSSAAFSQESPSDPEDLFVTRTLKVPKIPHLTKFALCSTRPIIEKVVKIPIGNPNVLGTNEAGGPSMLYIMKDGSAYLVDYIPENKMFCFLKITVQKSQIVDSEPRDFLSETKEF